MKSLFIDTSTFFMNISVLEDKEVLASFHEEVHMDMASKIIPIIEELFLNLPFTIHDIDKIFVVNGPGSFTGVRVGVTVAKTMAWALKKTIVPLSSLEFLATTPVDTKYVIPAIDARRGYVYAGVYDRSMTVILKNQYMPYDELKSYLAEGTVVSYDVLEGKTTPHPDVSKIIELHKDDNGVNPHQLNPNYLKLTEAEEKKTKEE